MDLRKLQVQANYLFNSASQPVVGQGQLLALLLFLLSDRAIISLELQGSFALLEVHNLYLCSIAPALDLL